MNRFNRGLAFLLMLSTTLMGLPVVAQASLISTEALVSVATESVDNRRDKINIFLRRDDVRSALESHGVSSAAAIDRVQAMTDAEVAQLSARVDRTPAGGDVLGLLFTVFIVLLVTDILGLTKVFPFTRSVR